MKQCSKCNTVKSIEDFYRGRCCRTCSNARLRAHRAATKNTTTRKYEKTKAGFLVRLYRNMKSRITGIQKIKYHLYKDKTLLDKQEFYKWAMNCRQFEHLFTKWQEAQYDRGLTPSVDRINSDMGYEISNMEWVTHSENSRRGSLSQAEKRRSAI